MPVVTLISFLFWLGCNVVSMSLSSLSVWSSSLLLLSSSDDESSWGLVSLRLRICLVIYGLWIAEVVVSGSSVLNWYNGGISWSRQGWTLIEELPFLMSFCCKSWPNTAARPCHFLLSAHLQYRWPSVAYLISLKVLICARARLIFSEFPLSMKVCLLLCVVPADCLVWLY